jgi:hypothetical protein
MIGLLSVVPSIINLINSNDKTEATINLINDVAETLGVEPTKEKITAHLEANPEDAIKLRDIELEAKKLIFADIANARDMNVKLQQNGSYIAKNTASILSLAVVGLCFCLFYLVLMGELTLGEGNVGMLIGGAIGFVTQILSFYFGSSEIKGERDG